MTDEPDRAAELGKKLGRAVRAAKPHAKRLAAEAGPKVEKAREDALQFAREHETEAKQIAQQLARAQLRGPLGMVFDALVPQPEAKVTARVCATCQTSNAAGAKFCSQCGTALAVS